MLSRITSTAAQFRCLLFTRWSNLLAKTGGVRMKCLDSVQYAVIGKHSSRFYRFNMKFTQELDHFGSLCMMIDVTHDNGNGMMKLCNSNISVCIPCIDRPTPYTFTAILHQINHE